MAQYPPAPRPGSRRGREHATQRNDANTDRFVERFFEFPFPVIDPGSSATRVLDVMSMGSRYIVIPAIRGTLQMTGRIGFGPPTGLEAAHLFLRLTLNGVDDWIEDGRGGNAASLQALFACQNTVKNTVGLPALQLPPPSSAPWFWFAHPHRLRAGDNLQATITNTFPEISELSPSLRPQLTLRFCDADIYWDLYGRLVDIAEATDEDLLSDVGV
jgi:hypothetical protein